jgi:hypothetical protein
MLLMLTFLGFLSLYFIFQIGALDGLLLLYNFHYHKEKDVFKGLVQTIVTLAWIGYVFIYQKLSKNIIKRSTNQYDVHYLLGSRLYKIRIFSSRGPRKVLQVIDDKNNDVTTDIVSYLGPSEDFHGILYQPSHFDYEQLTFNLSNGDVKVFEKNEPIIVNDFVKEVKFTSQKNF